jgi:heat shock protein HslJ
MPTVAPHNICRIGIAGFIATWLLALPFAYGSDTGAIPGLSKELEGRLWRVSHATFEQEDIYPRSDDGSEAYLSFNNSEISGTLGCGQLTGRYNLFHEGVQIFAAGNGDTQACSSTLRRQAEKLITALNGAVRLERGGDDAFYVFDVQRKYQVRLELLSPGDDLSEFRATFWRLISLEGNTIAEQNAEVRLGATTIEISKDGFLAEFAFRYGLKKFSFNGPFSTTRPGGRDLPPLFKTFEQVLRRIASYTVSGDELATLDPAGRQIMLLKRIRPTGLEHRFWHIAEYAADGELKHTVSPQFQVITFVGGKVEGTAGCSALIGVYTLAGNSLSVQAGSSGVGYCPEQDRNENDLVMLALNQALRVRDDGNRVLLEDERGNINIVLIPFAQQTPH